MCGIIDTNMLKDFKYNSCWIKDDLRDYEYNEETIGRIEIHCSCSWNLSGGLGILISSHSVETESREILY